MVVIYSFLCIQEEPTPRFLHHLTIALDGMRSSRTQWLTCVPLDVPSPGTSATFSFSLHFLHPHIDGLHRRMVVDSKFAPGQRPSRMSPVMTSGMEMESHPNPPKVSTSVILRVKYSSVLLSNTQRYATRNHWTWAPGRHLGRSTTPWRTTRLLSLGARMGPL